MQCLDYFTQLRNSLREQDIIFRFEASMEFGVGECALLDQLCLQMGFPRDDLPAYLSGENPLVLDNFPELGFFRDIVYLFKALLAPSSESLPELRPWRARDAALSWAYKQADGGGLTVRGFGGKLKCAAFVKPEDLVNKGGFLTRLKGVFGLSKPRAPLSGADPSNLVGEKVETEDDVLHIKSLPTFENRISPRQTELLLQYLTVPYLRIPLVLQFFACQEHVAALGSEALQEVLDACLFEPGQWQAEHAKEVPAVVPPPKRSHLATPCGLLFNELVRSPYNIMASLEKMLDLMLEHDTGRYSAASSPTILYVVRLVVQVESFVLFLLDQERCRELRGLACAPAHLAVLSDSQVRLRTKLNTVVFPMLERWQARVIKKKELHKACVVSAHLAYLFRNLRPQDLNYTNVSTLLCAQVFLTINFRFDVDISVQLQQGQGGGADREKEDKDAVRRDLGVPQLEVFHVFTTHRAKMLAWLQSNPAECDEVMEAVIRTVTLTGSREVPKEAEGKLKSRHWESMTRKGCVGRFLPDTELKGVMEMIQNQAKLHESFEEWLRATTTMSADTEVNTQLGEFTLKKHQMGMLEPRFALHPDLVYVLGPLHKKQGALQCCEVQTAANRLWIRLVGLRHDIQCWVPDTRPIPNPYSRPYTALDSSEGWIAQILDPVRQLYFPELKLFLPAGTYKGQSYASLCGLWETKCVRACRPSFGWMDG